MEHNHDFEINNKGLGLCKKCLAMCTIPQIPALCKPQEATGEECKHEYSSNPYRTYQAQCTKCNLPLLSNISEINEILKKVRERAYQLGIGQECDAINESLEPTQECRHYFDEKYRSKCGDCYKQEKIANESNPTEVPQEGWVERFDRELGLYESEMIDMKPVKDFISQELSQAEQKGYERGIRQHTTLCRKEDYDYKLRKAVGEIENKILEVKYDLRENDPIKAFDKLTATYNKGIEDSLAILKKLLD